MNSPSSTFGGDPSTATLARISTEFDAIARQMSTVSAEFAELRRIVAEPDEPARDVAPAPQSAVQPPAAGLTPPTVAAAPAQAAGPRPTPPSRPWLPTAPPPVGHQRPPIAPPGPQGPPPMPRPASARPYPPVASPPRPAGPSMSERIGAAAERGLIGKILATAGVGVTLIGVALLLVLAAQAGLLRPEFRVAGGAVLAAALVAGGIWSRGRPDGRIGAIALTATGIAAGYLDVLAATKIYDWLPIVVGLGVAGLVAAAGLALAHRWRSEHLGLLVVVPLIALAPVLTGGLDTTLIAFMVVLAAASAWVQLGRDWIWLHAVRLAAPTIPLTLVGVLALAGWTSAGAADTVFAAAVVVVVVLGVAGALIAMPTTQFRETLAGLASATTIPALFAGAVMNMPGAVILQTCIAGALIGTVLIGSGLPDSRTGSTPRVPDVVAQIWSATALLLLFVAVLVAFDGTVAITVLLGLATVTALVARTWSTTSRVLLAGGSVLWAIGFAALLDAAPPYVLADADLMRRDASLGIVVASVLAAAGALVLAAGWARLTDEKVSRAAHIAAGVVVVYALTAISVTAGVLVAGSDGFLAGHVLATTCWMVLAGTALAYARRRTGAARTAAVTGGLVLVAAAMAKLFLFDLATLDGIFRVIVFIVTGLILLGLGAWYARALQDDPAEPSSATAV
ncbi:DUF2339 domain-containing protein [Gordonia sp. WA4-43]|uniref:DUF2339 domain-containing protein n=1 Tax=Gordonia sp. WA4-43 TaxID=2878678 RepID=UPI001CF96FB2|nr:DUF2339 domain-containing protein [Gordonia sp. WA4-43]UCZ91532.1 DUF2339 domain-containing protein [Gordonia sp. WA4-43]